MVCLFAAPFVLPFSCRAWFFSLFFSSRVCMFVSLDTVALIVHLSVHVATAYYTHFGLLATICLPARCAVPTLVQLAQLGKLLQVLTKVILQLSVQHAALVIAAVVALLFCGQTFL